MAKTRRARQANKFCGCIKSVRRSVTLRKGAGKGLRGAKLSRQREAAAIAICTKSVLQTKGRTLRKFRCGKKGRRATLQTQPLL